MFDSHVHAAPDIVSRIGDDVQLARAFAAEGFSGFVLKAHYESTVGRAQSMSTLTGMNVVGGVALNHHVGGINSSAVAAALESGGRVIWMPTADSHTQQTAKLPRLADHDSRLTSECYALPPVDPTTRAEAEIVLSLVADHDAVLASGHVSDSECEWLMERAQHYGIKRFLLTHPSFTVPNLSAEKIAFMVANGAYVEITAYQLLHQPGCTPQMLAQVAEASGSRLILSSDAGQSDSPMPADALRQLVETLAREGLDRAWLMEAASSVPSSVFLR